MLLLGGFSVGALPTLPTISGLMARFDANTLGLADGASVASWTDLSGNGRDATQATPAKRPIYKATAANGLPTLRFSSAQATYLQTALLTLYPEQTWFLVAKAVYPIVSDVGMLNTADQAWTRQMILRLTGMSYEAITFWGSPVNTPTDAQPCDPFTWNVVCVKKGTFGAETVVNCQSNGIAPPPSSGTPSSVNNKLGIGSGGAPGFFWDGDIAEVLMYDRVLTAPEQLSVETYLTDKYQVARYVPQLDERLYPVTAPAMVYSVAMNHAVESTSDWAYAAAKAMGCSSVRIHPGWGSVEPYTGAYNTTGNLEIGLDLCAKYGLRPYVVTGYGPAVGDQRFWTVAAPGAPIGSYVIPLVEDPAVLDPPMVHVTRFGGAQLVDQGRWSYNGALIHARTSAPNTIELASPTTQLLVAGDRLQTWRLRYESIKSESITEPGAIAFVAYCQYVAGRIAAPRTNAPNGLVGDVEIWNEPPWTNDAWDGRHRWYEPSHLPGDVVSVNGGMNWGFLRLLMADKGNPLKTPPGVRFVNGGPHKSGGNSLLGTRMNPAYPTLSFGRTDVEGCVASECFHPYMHIPEGHGWDPRVPGYTTGLVGTNLGSNFKTAAWQRQSQQNLQGWSIRQDISEVSGFGGDFWNDASHGYAAGTEIQKARAMCRVHLYYVGVGHGRIFHWNLTEPVGGSGCGIL